MIPKNYNPGHYKPTVNPMTGSRLEIDIASHVIYYFKHESRVHLAKSRYGKTGDLTPDQFLDLALRIFSQKIFNDTALVFQEGLIDQMKDAINKILKRNLLGVINKNDTI